jgi:aromatic-L-amino-acid/L-tryptophan decarboxylase
LLELEKVARDLEPLREARATTRDRVIEYSEDFLDRVDRINAFNVSEDKGAGLFDSPITDDGIPVSDAISLLRDNVDFPGLNPASGAHLAYIPGGGIYYSALGDYLADVFNRYAGVYYASPGAVRMENMLIRWMNGLVGYP